MPISRTTEKMKQTHTDKTNLLKFHLAQILPTDCGAKRSKWRKAGVMDRKERYKGECCR